MIDADALRHALVARVIERSPVADDGSLTLRIWRELGSQFTRSGERGAAASRKAWTDAALIAGLARRDANEFEEVMSRYLGRLAGYARGRLRDQDTANDLVQNTFIVLLKKRERLDAALGSLESFLFGVLRNELKVHLARAAARRPVEPLDESTLAAAEKDEEQDAAHARLLEREDRDRLVDAIGRLDELDQEIIVRSLNGEAPAAIANDLDLAPVHVRVLKHRALATLRAALGGGDR